MKRTKHTPAPTSPALTPAHLAPALAGMAVAVVMTWWALTWAADLPELRSWPAAVPPFGFNLVILVHALASLPLAWLLSYVATRRGGRAPSTRGAALFAAVAAALALATMYTGSAIGNSLTAGTGFGGRLVLRTVWCLALELPWCLAWWMLADTRWLKRLSGAPLRETLILASVAAIGLPGMQAANLISTRTDTAERLISENQTLRAWRVVDGLTQLGSQRRIRDTRPETLLTALHQQVLLHGQAAAVTLPEDAPPTARIEQARHLFALEMLDDALAALGDLPDENVEAALLAANVAAQQRRWAESTHWSQRSLTLLDEQESRDPAALEQRLASYLTLATSLRSEKKYRQAEDLLHTALERLPEASAELHFQLGQHYELGGNPRRAVEHLETAIKLNPIYAKNAGAIINMIRNDTPLCMFEPYRPVAR